MSIEFQRLVPCDAPLGGEDRDGSPSTGGEGEGRQRGQEEEFRDRPPRPESGPLRGRDFKLRGSFWKGRSSDEEKKRVTWNPHVHEREFSREDDEEEADLAPGDLLTWQESVLELKKLLLLVGPIAAMNLVWLSRLLISLAFLGHMGNVQLAGGALAIVFANITAFSVMFGLGSSIEPLYAEAYATRKFKLMGLVLQKGILLLLCFSLPVALLWLNAKSILVLCRQEPEIADVAQHFLRHYIPNIAIVAVMQPLTSFLRSQTVTMPMLWCALVAVALHIPANALLVNNFDLGVRGVALASCLTELNFTVLLVAHTWRSGIGSQCLYWDLPALLRRWGPLLRLALPSCAVICLEWWCYELVILVSGLLWNPEISVGAMAILGCTSGLASMLPLALGASISMRVATELGARRPVAAQQSTAVALLLSAWVGLTICAVVVGVADSWGQIFTSDDEILDEVTGAQRIVGIEKVLDTVAAVAFGILRGTVRPGIGSRIKLGSLYLLGIPLALISAFKLRLGVLGLWLGLSAAQCACCVLGTAFVLLTNWTAACMRAQELVAANKGYEAALAALDNDSANFVDDDGEELVSATIANSKTTFVMVDSDDEGGQDRTRHASV